MRPPVAVLAILACALIVASVGPAAVGQAPQGRLLIQTDVELIGIAELQGGGHVTWTLSGEEAIELRQKILWLFDGYPQIPRGFAFAGGGTNALPNGVVDAGEAGTYTGYLENELEGTTRGFSGTDIGYYRLERADLLDASAVQRSTTGLVGSNASDATDLQIRFLFNGKTRLSEGTVPLVTSAYADALHGVFSFEARQSTDLTPDPWPLLGEDGWHVVSVAGTPALWAGNDTTGRYSNNEDASTRTAPLDAVWPGLDLRFATRASATFQYRGQVADAGDALYFEAALGPNSTVWNTIQILGATGGAWTNVSIDLAPYLGQHVRFRFRFTSDGVGTSDGFFIREFAVVAPSVYEGLVVESDAHYLIGLLSFSDPSVAGGANLVRTPGGEILWAWTSWNAPATPTGTIGFRSFNIAESPQILFIVMLAAAYFISHSQEAAVDRYREAHPTAFRAGTARSRSLRILGRVGIALLVLLYFLPTAFYNLGIPIFISGLTYWAFAVSLAIGLGLGSRTYYAHRREPVPQAPAAKGSFVGCQVCLLAISELERAYDCPCGAPYHLSCASDIAQCGICQRPVAVEVVSKKRSLTVQCATCGASQELEEDQDPRSIECIACGASLRMLDPGRTYLLVEPERKVAFLWLRDLMGRGQPGLCLTTAAPDRFRIEYGIADLDVRQISTTSTGGIDPRSEALGAVMTLGRLGKGGTVLIDGVDQMVQDVSLEFVLRFLRKVLDGASAHGLTVIARAAPGVLNPEEMQLLVQEFRDTIRAPLYA